MASDTPLGLPYDHSFDSDYEKQKVVALLAPMRNRLHELRYQMAVIRDSQMTEAEFVTYLDGLNAKEGT